MKLSAFFVNSPTISTTNRSIGLYLKDWKSLTCVWPGSKENANSCEIGEYFQGCVFFGTGSRISHDPVPVDARSGAVCEKVRVDPTGGLQETGHYPTSFERSSAGKIQSSA